MHRATPKYGWSHTTFLPGDTAPVVRGVSPRNMTAVYALAEDNPGDGPAYLDHAEHGVGVCAVLQFVDEDDLDSPELSLVAKRSGTATLPAPTLRAAGAGRTRRT